MNDNIPAENQNLNTAEPSLSALPWIAEQIPGGFFIYRADDTEEILYANRSFYSIYGCDTPEEFRTLTGGTFHGCIHPEDHDRVQNSIHEQIADSDNKNMDTVSYRIIRRDGSIRWVSDYGHYARYPGAGPAYFVFIWDITEEHMAREESELAAQVISGLSVDFTSIYLLNLDTGAMRPYRLKNRQIADIADKLRDKNDKIMIFADRYRLHKKFSRKIKRAPEIS